METTRPKNGRYGFQKLCPTRPSPKSPFHHYSATPKRDWCQKRTDPTLPPLSTPCFSAGRDGHSRVLAVETWQVVFFKDFLSTRLNATSASILPPPAFHSCPLPPRLLRTNPRYRDQMPVRRAKEQGSSSRNKRKTRVIKRFIAVREYSESRLPGLATLSNRTSCQPLHLWPKGLPQNT